MAETKHIEVPQDQWVDLSDLVGSKNGRVSNSGNATIVYSQGPSKPDDSSTKGHRLVDNNFFDFVVNDQDTIWVKAFNSIGALSVTPDIAINVFGGAIDVHNADVHFEFFNAQMHKDSDPLVSTTTVSQILPGDTQFAVLDSNGFSVGSKIIVNDSGLEEPIIYTITQPIVSNLIIIDLGVGLPFGAGSTVRLVSDNVASTAGTLQVPQVYSVGPPAGQTWHILKFLFTMRHSSAGDDSRFGNISGGLLNGVVFRVVIGGIAFNITNTKTNGEIANISGTLVYLDKVGSGDFSTRSVSLIKDSSDAVISLNGDNGDHVDFVVQDNLESLIDLKANFQGHVIREQAAP